MNAGKGDKPRNCFSKQYKNNYEKINWEKNKQSTKFKKVYSLRRIND